MTVTDEDREQINKIYYLLELTEEWRAYQWPQAQAGSAIAGDDAKTDPHQVSHLIAQATSAAVDHLHCLRKSMRGEDANSLAIHIRAPFSLTRGAIENVSTALWLMSAPARHERVLRRLRYEWASIKAAESFMTSANLTDQRGIQRRKNRVLALASTAGITEQELSQKPGFGEIIKAAGAAVDLVDDDGRNFPFLLWRLCSGIAHGDTWVLNLFDLEFLHTLNPGVSAYQMTAPIPLLWTAVQAAMTMTSLTYQKYAMQISVHR
jgi:hypothetical protein